MHTVRVQMVQAMLGVVMVGTAACEADRSGAARPRGVPADLAEMRGLHLVQYEAGERTLDLRAERAELHHGSRELVLAGVKGELLGPPGEQRERPRVRLAAPVGRADLEAERLRLAGGVQVDNGEFRLEVPTLAVDRGSRQARSEDQAVVHGPGFRAEGRGLLLEWERERLELRAEVQARYHGTGGSAL